VKAAASGFQPNIACQPIDPAPNYLGELSAGIRIRAGSLAASSKLSGEQVFSRISRRQSRGDGCPRRPMDSPFACSITLISMYVLIRICGAAVASDHKESAARLIPESFRLFRKMRV
jgi:hypothetical protein